MNRIEYNKKPGKPTVIKAVKDQTVQRDDLYKSGTIHTGQGEPPNSVSRPTPRPKQVAGKPITSGKLLRPGGPGGGPSKLASRPAASRPAAPRPVPQPIPQHTPQHTTHYTPQQIPQLTPQPVHQQTSQGTMLNYRPDPQPAAAQARPLPQPLAGINGIGHGRSESASSLNRAPPPPPPAGPPAAKKDTFRALYDFAGQTANELTIQKDEILEVVTKDGNGKFASPSFNPFIENTLLTFHHRLVARKKTRRLRSRLDSLRLFERRVSSASSASTTSRPVGPSTSPHGQRHERKRPTSSRCSRKGQTHTPSPARQKTCGRRQETSTSARTDGQG